MPVSRRTGEGARIGTQECEIPSVIELIVGRHPFTLGLPSRRVQTSPTVGFPSKGRWWDRAGDDSRRLAREAVAALRARQVDGIILGCTEIPLLLGAAAAAPDMLNAAQLLAEAAVARAIT